MKKFKKNKTYTKLSRVLATLLLLTFGFAYGSGITAFAAVDLDVTIVPPEDTVQNGHNFDVNLEILTKSDNGYVELEINIEYDADLLALYAPVNQDGYKVTGSRGQLKLTYFDPTGTNTPTPIGNDVPVTITFTVLENAPDTTTKIKATIDHAYNERGKNVTWTPIYDKEIEIIRINESVSSDEDTSSEEESSQFVVGKNTGAGTVSRSSGAAGNGGKVASVIIGAIVVFVAGMVAGYIVCMRKYEKSGVKTSDKPVKTKKRHDSRDDYYDDYDDNDYDDYEYKSRSIKKRSSVDEYEDYDNEDGFYTKPQENSRAGSQDNYYTARPAGSGAGGNYLDAFAAPMGSRSISADEFNNIIDGKAKLNTNDDDDDDYPILFMTRDGGGSSARRRGAGPQTKPTFDEEEDTIFGKFSSNVERNVDDGYGGISSTRSRDRSERSRRNR